MLLDTHSLKNILVDLTLVGGDQKQPSVTYVKILGKSISKIEQLLKVVLRPHTPPQVIIETYMVMYNDHDVSNMIRILELKV